MIGNLAVPVKGSSSSLVRQSWHDQKSSPSSDSVVGRNLIAVIGIDRYQRWPLLSNAVNDACGALALFERLGFVEAAMLIDDAATGRAIQSLVTDDLATMNRFR
jgi:hypothetical protein